MNNNEVPPDYWDGRHSDQPSSAEFVKLIMAELGNLLQTHPQNGGIVINYYNSVGQRIDSVHTQNFATDKWTEPMMPTERKASIPPPEKMAKAVEHTMAKGYWWASTSWAVVYRVYQLHGYGGGFSQFVKEVATWPRTRPWEMECNFDAVQKPVTSGRLSGTPEMWKANGAQEQAIKLGLALMDELQTT